ncbi:TPA: hypothetical protein ACH3X1_011238 [Trebouxia sp. C0004]
MTEAERRHLRRTVSNRSSAQRVQERMSAVMRDMEIKDVASDAASYQLDCKEVSMGLSPSPAQTDSDMACDDGTMADCLVAANALAANLPMMVMLALCYCWFVTCQLE